MNDLKKALFRGIGRELGRTIGKAVTDTVSRQTGQPFYSPRQENPSYPNQQPSNPFSGLEQRLQGYATQLAQELKVCPNCQKPASADQQFCNACGTQLPRQTIAQGAVCAQCGVQNGLGAMYCRQCGSMLPAAAQQREAAAMRDAQTMSKWESALFCFPKWCCGGWDYSLEDYGEGQFVFSASFGGNHAAARQAVEQYRQFLLQQGFRQAGMYPSPEHLYQRVNGIVVHVDLEHCFDGDADRPCIGLLAGEPQGGFDYEKPAPRRRRTDWRNLLGE